MRVQRVKAGSAKRDQRERILENPINFEGLFSGKPAMKICSITMVAHTQFITASNSFFW